MMKPVVLCILDGWGISNDAHSSAIANANTKFYDSLLKKFPNTEIEASGIYVGLLDGQMGSSEVGHTNIGAGRVVYQDLPRITKYINEGKLDKDEVLLDSIGKTKDKKGRFHLLGLLSDGGVHSHIDHIIELAKIISTKGVEVLIHAFLDGRDTPQKSAIKYLESINKVIAEYPNIKIATIGGRYYGMDRDKNWDRTKMAYDIIVSGDKFSTVNAIEVVNQSYDNDITDEFIKPVAVDGYDGMHDNDSFIFCNFRADRARQLSMALVNPNFLDFKRDKIVDFTVAIEMTKYSTKHEQFLKTLFKKERISDCLGKVISKHNLKQLRLAETEKFAHVTFFFNCGKDTPFPNEDRILVKSPNVATYDLQPEMSLEEVCNKFKTAIESDTYNLIIMNFANPDMVGHTGNFKAAVKACEFVDKKLREVVNLVLQHDGTIFITADHGNIEKMIDSDSKPCTTHTNNKVPFIYVTNNPKTLQLKDNGALCDIAPTILKEMSIVKPTSMKGRSLI